MSFVSPSDLISRRSLSVSRSIGSDPQLPTVPTGVNGTLQEDVVPLPSVTPPLLPRPTLVSDLFTVTTGDIQDF